MSYFKLLSNLTVVSFRSKPMKDWTTADFMSFISSLKIKGQPYNQIKVAVHENGLSAEQLTKSKPNEIQDLCGINIITARKISNALKKLNVTQSVNCLPTHSPPTSATMNHISQEGAFTVNIRGKQGRLIHLRKQFTKDSTVGDIALSFQEQECVKMSSKVDKIILVVRTKIMQEDRTLGYYGIVSENNLITAVFKTRGGAMALNGDMERCIKFKKHGLRQTSLSDVLIGYDDDDGVERALLECGKHAMAAETMFMYITSSLSTNLKQTDIICPGKGCAKVLNWQICTQIADMNAAEYIKWTDVVEKRAMANYKQCPHCKAYCLRDDGVAIFRMKCVACNGSDWCWECAQPWKGSGLSMCCNQNCSLIMNTNSKLRDCPTIKVAHTNVAMPQFRACPRCLTFIEYSTACKHMICSGCDKRFCFVCLGLQDSDGNYPCGSYDTVCKMADRQQFK
eukprot:67460_1